MKSKSFIKVITVFFSVTYFVMLLLMGVSISFTLKNITINVIDSVSRELSQEQSRIAKEMDSCERFLLTFSPGSSDIGTITLNQRDAAYYSSLYRVKTEFADVLSSMEYTDGLFAIPCEGQDFIYSYRGGDESFLDIRRYVRNSIDSGEIETLPGRYWNLINTEGNYPIDDPLSRAGMNGIRKAVIDDENTAPLKVWNNQGRPEYPTKRELAEIEAASELNFERLPNDEAAKKTLRFTAKKESVTIFEITLI